VDEIEQSKTTLEAGHGRSDATVNLMRNDLQRLAMAAETLVVQVAGLKSQLTGIEKTLTEIAIGLGVEPK
jgi:hypothetical protein